VSMEKGMSSPLVGDKIKLGLTGPTTRCKATSAGIFKQSMGSWNRVGIVLPYRPARLHSLAELVPWNRFLGFLKI
jgi:hypothetical protein